MNNQEISKKGHLKLQEFRIIESMIKRNFSIRSIAKYLKRSLKCIYNEINLFKTREDYSSEESYEIHKKRRLQSKKKKLQMPLKTKETKEKNSNELEKRIQNIEFQIEIILDEIKNLSGVK
jgi:IS30 family transposase